MVFGIPLRDAWGWTLFEYQTAFRVYIEREEARARAASGKGAPLARQPKPKNIRSSRDVEELEAHLKKIGALK